MGPGLRRATPSLRAPSSQRPPKIPRTRPDAEGCLERAMAAATPRARAAWARRGLAVRAPIDRDTRALLLHQLYLARYAEGRFREAYAVARDAVALDVLVDVMHEDAARAMQALGDIDGAVKHLRLAVRQGPASR